MVEGFRHERGRGVGLVGEIGGVLWCEQTQVWWVVELRLIGPIQALIQTIGIQNRSVSLLFFSERGWCPGVLV